MVVREDRLPALQRRMRIGRGIKCSEPAWPSAEPHKGDKGHPSHARARAVPACRDRRRRDIRLTMSTERAPIRSGTEQRELVQPRRRTATACRTPIAGRSACVTGSSYQRIEALERAPRRWRRQAVRVIVSIISVSALPERRPSSAHARS